MSNVALANDSWESLMTAHSALMKQFATRNIWGDVSMREYDVLYTLAKAGRPLRLGELNRSVLLSQPAMSRLVDRLVARDLVARVTDPEDRRSLSLSLTPAGRDAQRAVGREHGRDVAAAMTAALDDDELVALQQLCTKLVAAAAPDLPQNQRVISGQASGHKRAVAAETGAGRP